MCWRRLCFLACVLVLVWRQPAPLRGHEVDQYDFPAGQELIDHGDYWNELLHGAVCRAVLRLNRALDATDKGVKVPGFRQARLAQLRSPGKLTWAVRHELPNSMWAIEGLELKLRRSKPEGELPASHFSSRFTGTYGGFPSWPDPRTWNRMSLLRCSTMKIHGHYVGVDKVGHFVGMGAWYYTYYQAARATGKTKEEALRMAVKVGQKGPISENWLVGGIPTGIYSNADMASNYLGLKYYINVTEPVSLEGTEQPPMVVFDGQHWVLQPHVRPEYFTKFISPHFDEVLNPCCYEWTFRKNIQRHLESRSEALLTRYAGQDPARRSPDHFDRVLVDCLTYYGEDYGHCGDLDKLLTISKICFHSKTTVTEAVAAVRRAQAAEQLAAKRMPPEKAALPKIDLASRPTANSDGVDLQGDEEMGIALASDRGAGGATTRAVCVRLPAEDSSETDAGDIREVDLYVDDQAANNAGPAVAQGPVRLPDDQPLTPVSTGSTNTARVVPADLQPSKRR